MKRNKNRKDYSKKLKELELERFFKRKEKIEKEKKLQKLSKELESQLDIAILKD